MLYMVTWIPSIYPLYVSIYTSTMDPMGYVWVNLYNLTVLPHWNVFLNGNHPKMGRKMVSEIFKLTQICENHLTISLTRKISG